MFSVFWIILYKIYFKNGKKNTQINKFKIIYLIKIENGDFVRIQNFYGNTCDSVLISVTTVHFGKSAKYKGADKSLARPTSRCIFLMIRIFHLMLVLLYIYI